jgi:hypothetical protein
MDAPDQPDREERDRGEPDRGEPHAANPPDQAGTATGPDIATIGLLVFFIALIGIVAALLLLPILAGGAAG